MRYAGKQWAFSENIKKNSKITYTASRFLLLTGAKFAVRAAMFEEHNKEFIIFILYLMASLCVIFKSV